MRKQYAIFQKIEHNEHITEETHYLFLVHLQKAILLALREQGWLTAMQYRHAEDLLKQQRRDRAKQLLDNKKHP